jgi:RNA polymerase sigma-70 factor (ECF subfamily)
MTTVSQAELELLRRNSDGDDVAARLLLLPHVVYLSDFIAAKYPKLDRGMTTVEDVIQETLVDAYRQIDRFDPTAGTSLRTWLTTIAERRASGAVRRQQRIKRGGKHQRVEKAATESSVYDIVEMLSAASHTASRSAMRHEAVQAVHDAIDELPDHYRQAVRLHLLEGKRLAEVAAVMNRSPRAVQGLIDRAKKQLAAVLGRLSLYE